MDNALIVVAKEPVPGATKTRLCPPLSPEESAALYQCLLLDTLALMARLETADRTVAYTPLEAHGYFRGLAQNGFRLVAQEGVDLGERLANALGQHFELGYRRAVIMNSDGPTLPLTHLQEAFDGLGEADVTLGPGHDGGYYLIGMKELHQEVFEGITWSTGQVIPETLAACRRLGLRVHLLPEWYDVDVGADLVRLRRDLEREPALAPHTWSFLRDWGEGRLSATSPGG
jgi:rSAM/selenodomain-associated transferase 1